MIHVVSFGCGHPEPPPAAHLTVDVRNLFRDPHVDPAMRELTGRDTRVIDSVMSQPGAVDFVQNLAVLASRLDTVHSGLTVAIGCVGGRHRSVVLADALASRLAVSCAMEITVKHRDIDKPVLARGDSRDR